MAYDGLLMAGLAQELNS
ncbi:hypothetical protein ADUPG1_003246, partial [Aduncisulcus paluster]